MNTEVAGEVKQVSDLTSTGISPIKGILKNTGSSPIKVDLSDTNTQEGRVFNMMIVQTSQPSL